MSYIEIILLAIALSIDACVVSFSYGLAVNACQNKTRLLLACTTSFFQGLLPILGYILTNIIKTYIEPFANWIVFAIFVYLGLKFITEACNPSKQKPCCIDFTCLLLIGIATSIDAFSAGISLSLYGNRIMKPALLIALITFINSNFGFLIGEKMRKFSTKFLEIMAGIILIGLGIKALF